MWDRRLELPYVVVGTVRRVPALRGEIKVGMMGSPIVDQIEDTALAFPGRLAVIDRDRVLTYGQLLAEVRACSNLLSTLGAGPGQAVGLLMSNAASSVAALLGIARTESAAILFPPSLPAVELRRYLFLADINMVIAASSHRALAEAAGGRAMARAPGNLEAFGVDTTRRTEEVLRGDFIGQLTSGVDHPSKLAIRTHGAVRCEIQDFADEIDLNADDSTLVLPSLSHSYGLIGGTLAPLCRGGRVILRPDFRAEEILALIRDERPSILYAVPFMYRAFAMLPAARAADMDSLRLCFSAGGPLPREVDDEFVSRFGRRICQNYGTTEVGVICVRREWTPEVRDSVGRPIRRRLVTITDEHRRPLAPGSVGEVVVHSPALARGYLGVSDHTSAVPRTGIVDGSLITGDLGRMSEVGDLFLLGRKRQMLHIAGVAVDPAAIEDVIAALPGVREVAVVGIPHEAKGEVAKAVVAAEGLTAADVVRHCRRSTEDIHVPEIVEFRTALPRTPAGKILRRVLRDPA